MLLRFDTYPMWDREADHLLPDLMTLLDLLFFDLWFSRVPC